MGYNSARYVHNIYQAMNLAFADRDFYYGDPYFPPEEPVKGLLSKEYAQKRRALINPDRNDPDVRPGDPYEFQGGTHPYRDLLASWKTTGAPKPKDTPPTRGGGQDLPTGTTSIEPRPRRGGVSVTHGGCCRVIAGRTGMGMSQRMQSFVLDEAEGPYNVVVPGKRPRATLTPSLALKDGKPFLAFSVQGGDSQDQNLLQFFLNVVEFGMNVQGREALELHGLISSGTPSPSTLRAGRITLTTRCGWVRGELTPCYRHDTLG